MFKTHWKQCQSLVLECGIQGSKEQIVVYHRKHESRNAA
jgi:hypothetical protein